jgi:transposase
VMVAVQPVDFRKGIDGLAAIVKEELGTDPYSGVVYVFRARRAQRATFYIQFAVCEDCLSLAPAVRSHASGISLSAG